LGLYGWDAIQPVFSQKEYLYVISIFIISVFGNVVFEWGGEIKMATYKKETLDILFKEGHKYYYSADDAIIYADKEQTVPMLDVTDKMLWGYLLDKKCQIVAIAPKQKDKGLEGML